MHRSSARTRKARLKSPSFIVQKVSNLHCQLYRSVRSPRPGLYAAAPRAVIPSSRWGGAIKYTDLGLDANLTSSNNCHARGWCGTACTTDAARCDAPANRAARPQARQPGRTAAAPGRQAGFKTSSQGRLSTTGTTRPMLTPMRSKPLCPAPAAPCPTGELSLWGTLAPACGELSLRLRSWRCRWAARAWARASVRLLTFFSLTSRLPTRYHD